MRDLYEDLREFHSDLRSYKETLSAAFGPKFSRSLNSPYDKDSVKRTELENDIEQKRECLVFSSGRLTPRITELTGEDTMNVFEFGKPRLVNIWSMGLRAEFDYRTAETLNACIDMTNKAIGKLKADVEAGVRDAQGNSTKKNTSASREPPKAFIAHGGDSKARDKLWRFLKALGVVPLVIEEEAKEGRSVDQQVEHYLNQADCAIILGTADDKELKDGKLYPRRNVHIEIGRFQERFPGRIVYLLEEGASFPSNIGEKLYTRFTHENMEEAFTTVARELKAFAILKAVKPE